MRTEIGVPAGATTLPGVLTLPDGATGPVRGERDAAPIRADYHEAGAQDGRRRIVASFREHLDA